jgi:hypothetical protein
MRRRLICHPAALHGVRLPASPRQGSPKGGLYVRRNVIEDVLDEQDMVLPVRRLADHGLKAWQQVLEHGYEGLVAKDPESRYVGGRSLKWLKVKQAQYREVERGSTSRSHSPRQKLTGTLMARGSAGRVAHAERPNSPRARCRATAE